MTEFNEEVAQMQEQEVRIVLEKFDGEQEDGILVERVHILNGEITHQEFIEDGNVVKTIYFEGGN